MTATDPASTVAPFPQRPFASVPKSTKLADVCYDIRGPVLAEAHRLEEEGHRILKLNLGNPAPFGLEAPEEILRDVIHNIPGSTGYCDAKGLYSARKAVMQECQRQGVRGVDIDDITIGNGVSELICMAMQGLLNDGDEILLPAPDYPLWTAAVRLAGGVPVHYRCDESADWAPDLDDVRAKTTARCRGIVVINPNNPTGAVYPQNVLEEIIRLGAPPAAWSCSPTRSTTRSSTTTRSTTPGRARRRCSYAHLQRPVEGLPRRRLPLRLDDRERPDGTRHRLHRGPGHPRIHAVMRERPGPARHPDGPRRLPEHQRVHRARWPAVRAKAASRTRC